jgi:hypothetical protein
MTNAPIPPTVEDAIDRLASGDRAVQGPSYAFLSEAVAGKVGWADSAWKKLEPLLRHKDNRVRSIAGQALCSLAPSASQSLVGGGLDELMSVTRDERFVTARHVLLALWKVGVDNCELRRKLLAGLSERFRSSGGEKNATLVRYDVVCTMRRLFDETGDEAVKAEAMALIPTEADVKYRKKYATAWRDA